MNTKNKRNKTNFAKHFVALRFKVFLVIPNMFFLEPDIRLPHGHHPGDHLLQTRRPKTPGDQDILGLTRTP